MTAIEPDLALTTVPSAFRAAVEKYPDNTALEAQGTSLSYRELDRLSNRIANGLLARGGEQPLAMVAPLEPLPIIVMLGALKAGRIFVPLDPRDPPERLALVLEQVAALRVSAEELEPLSASHEDDPSLSLDPGQRAIVHFTSGSSGRPRGIVRTHGQLALARGFFGVGPDDRFAIIVPLSFAGSIGPVFSTLFSGATGCLFDPTKEGIESLVEWIGDAAVTVLQSSPSVLRTIAASLDERGRTVRSVRLAVVGGEPCRGEDLGVVRRVLPAAAIANHYGSSEAGYVGETRIEPGVELPGGPISFQRIMQEVTIVDDLGQPVEQGETGEIVVRGPAVAPGYWAEPDEAEQRLVIDENGVRSARTGDRGRFLPDGSLEHLGRADLRVKVHGQMVDPQAVEHALRALPDVEEAVVSAVPGRDGDLRLVAHVLPKGRRRPKARDLRLALSRELPPFMIPAAFFTVDAIPRNERGKVDREVLRQTELDALVPEADYVAPRTEREQEIADVVAEVLSLERIGVHDDVFTLGADSFTSVELLTGIGERFGVDLTSGDLLEAPTVEALALRVDDGTKIAERLVIPLHASGSGTPFFLVAGAGGLGMLALRRLARRLDRPTYSFIPRGFDRRVLPDRTVERTAARFVRALQTVQPSGPYLIGGYSFGALVGYEMAQKLGAAGEGVALLVLLDPATGDPRYRGEAQRIVGGRRRDPQSRAAGVSRLVRNSALWMLHSVELATVGIVKRPLDRQLGIFVLLNLRMGRRYRPKPYAGRALALRTRSWDKLDGMDLGGRLLAGEKQLVDIPGDHITAIHEPHGAVLAAVLREALAEADPLTASLERTAE